ncbi:hypothetical protein E1180_19815 [Roseibium denhamense]|uniref:SAP domain-containing protein n=1 Tax=Roseibium denhamense TaxID=76305 RepID=A0ABY1P2Y3_9HYPH|nr:hypothetical protein [Roseibium denhamense]MTI07754.1 hypothetical protein [Roseibium denhamense]SMP25191.1 hypothetical protein SAMN06265374_2525 [Roseibium denhamense]
MQNHDLETLEKAIYFLKVPELKELLAEAGFPPLGSKQEMVTALLAAVRGDLKAGATAKMSEAEKALRKSASNYDAKTQIVPGVFTNNQAHRMILRGLIGSHFAYTTYGMDWIKAKWHEGICPSFEDFAAYWQGEYERRQNAGEFESKKTLQRVRFFRAMKDKGLTKAELEGAWAEERARQSVFARKLIAQALAG